MRTITNFFLANLAVADLCVGVFCVLPNLSTYLSAPWLLGRVRKSHTHKARTHTPYMPCHTSSSAMAETVRDRATRRDMKEAGHFEAKL